MSEQTIFDRWIFQIGGIAAILGALLGLVGNLIHPITPGPMDPEGTARGSLRVRFGSPSTPP